MAVEGDDKLKSDKQISKTQNMQKRHALSTIKVKKKLVKTKKTKESSIGNTLCESRRKIDNMLL